MVVLPLVPVTASQGGGGRRGPRSRQASSTSPMTSTPAAAAAAKSGLSRLPARRGDDQVGALGAASRASPSRTVTPLAPASVGGARRGARSPSPPSTTVTRAPRPARARAALMPLTPSPATVMCCPARSAPRRGHLLGRPSCVEEAEADDHAHALDDPEADHDKDLGPALEFEVVLERRHPEDALAGQPEGADLDDDGHGDQDEEAAEEREQQLGAGADRQAGERAAEGQRAGVAHEDLGGRGVPPQEAEAGAHQRGGDDGEVERVPDLVAGLRVPR